MRCTAVLSITTATPQREPMTQSIRARASLNRWMLCSKFGAGLGGPIVRNRLWFFVDYEQQLRNNPIPVINSALATTPGNLAAFLSDNFGIPAGTVLPPPNGPLPVPGRDRKSVV